MLKKFQTQYYVSSKVVFDGSDSASSEGKDVNKEVPKKEEQPIEKIEL